MTKEQSDKAFERWYMGPERKGYWDKQACKAGYNAALAEAEAERNKPSPCGVPGHTMAICIEHTDADGRYEGTRRVDCLRCQEREAACAVPWARMEEAEIWYIKTTDTMQPGDFMKWAVERLAALRKEPKP